MLPLHGKLLSNFLGTDKRKVELFLYNWCEIAANPTMHQNKAVSRLLLGKFEINDH